MESDIKKHARLNMISHLLSTIDYHEWSCRRSNCPPTRVSGNYQRPPRELSTYVDDHVATLIGDTEMSLDERDLMRIYIPVTLAMLQQLVADGSLRPVNGTAFAVTPKLREAYAEGDDDELGEVALREAALASLRLLAGAAEDDAVEGDRCRRDARCWSPMSATSHCARISTTPSCGSAAR